MDWQEVYANTPTLFIKGGLSSYIKPEYTETILKQFPNATSLHYQWIVGNWVHAENLICDTCY